MYCRSAGHSTLQRGQPTYIAVQGRAPREQGLHCTADTLYTVRRALIVYTIQYRARHSVNSVHCTVRRVHCALRYGQPRSAYEFIIILYSVVLESNITLRQHDAYYSDSYTFFL